jgi:YVTN family beta-propeller protein
LLLSVTALAAPPAPNYHQVKKIAVGGEGGWDYLTFDGATNRLYIARSTRVTVVDVQKGVVVGEVANTPGVHGVALVPTLHRGFTSNGKDDTVTVFDIETLKELERIKVGSRPDAIIFDPAVNRVFTFNGGSHDATAIDAASAKVVGAIPLGGKPEFAVADRKGQVFVNIEDKSEIVAFDSRALSVKHRWSLAPGEGPSGLAMDRKHRRLFAVCANEKMVVLDADSGRVVATPTIGKGPDAAAFDPGTGLAFSSNGRDGTLTVMQEQSADRFIAIATVPTQIGSRTMALDRKTHNIYLAAARFAPQPAQPAGSNAPRQRPTMEANSFVILVFGE